MVGAGRGFKHVNDGKGQLRGCGGVQDGVRGAQQMVDGGDKVDDGLGTTNKEKF